MTTITVTFEAEVDAHVASDLADAIDSLVWKALPDAEFRVSVSEASDATVA